MVELFILVLVAIIGRSDWEDWTNTGEMSTCVVSEIERMGAFGENENDGRILMANLGLFSRVLFLQKFNSLLRLRSFLAGLTLYFMLVVR